MLTAIISVREWSKSSCAKTMAWNRRLFFVKTLDSLCLNQNGCEKMSMRNFVPCSGSSKTLLNNHTLT